MCSIIQSCRVSKSRQVCVRLNSGSVPPSSPTQKKGTRPTSAVHMSRWRKLSMQWSRKQIIPYLAQLSQSRYNVMCCSEASTYQHGQTVFYQDAEIRPFRAVDSSHDCTTSPFESSSAVYQLANTFENDVKKRCHTKQCIWWKTSTLAG